MPDPLEQLRHALAHADIASAALRFIRPTPAQQSALRAVREMDSVLRTVIGAFDAAMEGAEGEDHTMHRRLLLKLGGAMASASIPPLEALDRLMAQRGRAGRVDRSLTDAYHSLLHGYGSVYGRMAPARLRPAVASILDRLLDAQRDGTTPGTRARLGQLTSDAASFAGWLAYDLGRPGSARAHFVLAANAARDAGDRRRWALALASEGINNSPATDGSAGDPRRALALLQQADVMLAAAPPHWSRPWVNAQAAAKGARLGAEATFLNHMEAAQELRQAPAERPQGFWHWFPVRSMEPDYLEDYRTGGLTRLDHPDAESTLLGITGHTGQGHRMAEAQQNLMQLYIRHHEYDTAARAGMRGLSAAREAGLTRWVEVVRGVRAQAPAGATAFAELDQALLGV